MPVIVPRHAARLLRPRRAARRHEPGRRARVVVLPVVPALLRPGVLGGARTRSSAMVCIQAYNDWMIEEWCGSAPGRFIPLIIIPLWDPAAGGRRDRALRGQGRARDRVLREPRAARAAHDPRSRRLLGPGHGRPATTTTMVVCMHVGSSSTLPTISPGRAGARQPRVGRGAHGRRDARLAVLRLLRPHAQPQDRAVGGRHRLDPVLPRAGRAGGRQAAALGAAEMTSFSAYDGPMGAAERRRSTTSTSAPRFRDHVFGCFIDDVHGICAASPPSARTT